MITVLRSHVSDGSMHRPQDLTDAEIIKNRIAYLKAHGIKPKDTTRIQVNYESDDFCRYAQLSEDHKDGGVTNDAPVWCDAAVTTNTNLALLLPIADCVGTVLYDPTKHVLMLSHLGRQSLEQDGGVKSVEYLRQKFGCDPQDLKVWLTAAPNKEAYPIWALNGAGMKESTLEQLERAGIVPEHIDDDTNDTVTNPDYFSHSQFLAGSKQVDGRQCIVAVMTD